MIYIVVRDGDLEQSLRALKKKMQREGVFREMRLREFYEKPCEERKRRHGEAIRRHRKRQRKIAAKDAAANPGLKKNPERARGGDDEW
jgi:small subunit ribosomal protein S21